MVQELFKTEENKKPERKLFANKAANIALGITGGLVLLAIIGAVIFVTVF